MTDAAAAPHPVVPLLRRWVVDYFNRHDPAACADFITPDYALRIGEVVLAGRDTQWLPAVSRQMALFPGLGMTVHQVLAGSDRAAVWFTEHGASAGRVACWSGVAIYRSDGRRLCGCVAQEDYATRARQLKSGSADPIDPPAPAPWDTPALPPDAQAESLVRAWLAQPWPAAPAAVRVDDEHLTGQPLAFAVDAGEVTELFSSGPEVAFHVRQRGRYLGGLAGVAGHGQPGVLHCNGIVRVHDGRVVAGRVIRDRAGLRAALLQR